MQPADRPRVLHVLGSLNRGGIETWLLDVLRNTPPAWWEPHFLLHRTAVGAYDAEMRARGATLHYCGGTRRPLSYARRLRMILREQGSFDVLHSHVHLYSGVVLRVAHGEGVPMRIAHAHTAKPAGRGRRRLYAQIMRRWIRRYATHGLACSGAAAAALFGADWREQPQNQICMLGRDFSAFAALPPRATIKRELGLPTERIVVGHVGRFAAVKNHRFLLDVFAALLRTGVDAQLLLVGNGPLEPETRRLAQTHGIAERCTFAGAQDDVARFFGAMDVFVLPSLYEGFGMVALEAQAAGVPVLASTGVPAQIAVIPELVQRRSLSEGPDAWARAIREALRAHGAGARTDTAARLMDSAFSISTSAVHLARLYRVGVPAAAGIGALP